MRVIIIFVIIFFVLSVNLVKVCEFRFSFVKIEKKNIIRLELLDDILFCSK